MAYIEINTVAYLTETGRKYLFDPQNSNRYVITSNGVKDKFVITHFSLSDEDVNYKFQGQIEANLIGTTANSGGSFSSCLFKTIKNEIKNEIVYKVNTPINFSSDNYYTIETINPENVIDINISHFTQ